MIVYRMDHFIVVHMTVIYERLVIISSIPFLGLRTKMPEGAINGSL